MAAWGVYVWGFQKSTADNLGPFLIWAFSGALGVVFALVGAVMVAVGVCRLGGAGAAAGPALVAFGALALVLA